MSRRQLLQAGAASWLGLNLPLLLRADSENKERDKAATADACILILLNGGPSHRDMWDMKPDAPAEIRGPFKPISSSLSGVQLCEHLPRLARQMHRCALIRSAIIASILHAAAVYVGLTGHDRGENGGGASRPITRQSVL